MKGGYFLLNGQFHQESECVFKLSDVTGRMDGFSESFRAEHNEVLFPEGICRHLLARAKANRLDISQLIDLEGRLLRKDVSRLLNKNKLYLAAKIGIRIYPSCNKINILLNAEEIDRGYFPVREPGLLISFFREEPGDSTCFFSSAPDLTLQQLAARRAEELKRPNMILLNKDGSASGSIGGSFGYIIENKVILPSESSAGYRYNIRNELIHSLKEAGFTPLEKENIQPDELLSAEELFLFDSCQGIQCVLGLEDQRYFSTKTLLIAEQLTSLAMQDRKGKM